MTAYARDMNRSWIGKKIMAFRKGKEIRTPKIGLYYDEKNDLYALVSGDSARGVLGVSRRVQDLTELAEDLHLTGKVHALHNVPETSRDIELRLMKRNGAQATRSVAAAGRESQARAERLDRRQMAYEKLREMGRPITPELEGMRVDHIERFILELEVTEKAHHVPEADLDVGPDKPALRDKLEAAAMDHAWGTDGPEDPPEADLGLTDSPDTPGGGAGEAAEAEPELSPDSETEEETVAPEATAEDIDKQLDSHIVTNTEPTVNEYTYKSEPEMGPSPEPEPTLPVGIRPGELEAADMKYLRYADKIEETIATSPDPEATKAAVSVMRNWPTADAAVEKTPSPRVHKPSDPPKKTLGKKLGRR